MPISQAVSASSALPMLYKPVKLRDRELVDGGIASTTNLDVAIEAGAKLIVVVNPLVPYVNTFEKRIPSLTGSWRQRVIGHGLSPDRLPGVQAARPPASSRARAALEGALSECRHHSHRTRSHRRADVQTSVMNLTSRVAIAGHGSQSVTLKARPRLPEVQGICERHRIEIPATRVRQVVKHFDTVPESIRAWAKDLRADDLDPAASVRPAVATQAARALTLYRLRSWIPPMEGVWSRPGAEALGAGGVSLWLL